MESLTSYQLRKVAEEHFAAIAVTPGIDQFCSSLDWTLPAHEAFIPDHPLYLLRNEHGFVNLAGGFNPRIGRYLQPLEASWCLASPFAGEDVGPLLRDFSSFIRDTTSIEWDLLYFSGIPTQGPLLEAIIGAFRDRNRLGVGHETSRFIASLDEGTDGWLSRRTSKFRSNLRKAAARAEEAGVHFEYVNDAEDTGPLYERILAIEERSWKGKSGTGILDGGMNAFYRIMLPRLQKRNALRAIFAHRDGEDLAFGFGGIFNGLYRGLQMSFDETHARLSLGNLIQHEMIRHLSDEGIERYDLGSELEYKARWAEERLDTITLWVWRA